MCKGVNRSVQWVWGFLHCIHFRTSLQLWARLTSNAVVQPQAREQASGYHSNRCSSNPAPPRAAAGQAGEGAEHPDR